jgi:2-polyprenyl-3-methyl-5-hydroxy-6-metoxy-1,4-benzoquinol methylase
MQINEIKEKKQKIIERFGPWTAGSIHLADQIDTFDEPHWDARLRRFVQIAADLAGKPLEKLRVLDLACLEGQYGIEFALHGADVLAIEGREANLRESAEFPAHAKEVMTSILQDYTSKSVELIRGHSSPDRDV